MSETARQINSINKIQKKASGDEAQVPYKLGRFIKLDARDGDYPMHEALKVMSPRILGSTVNEGKADIFLNSRLWDTGAVLNQGESNHCVGYSFRSFLDAHPLATRGGLSGDEVYYKATTLDEQPGDNTEDGTSIRAGVKALEAEGHIKQYVWAKDVETIAQFVLTQGTVVVGTNWHEAMFNPIPEDNYLLHPVGVVAGGHAWHIVGVDIVKRQFTMKNSWGTSWADRGFARIRYDDLSMLLANFGEAVAPLEEIVLS